MENTNKKYELTTETIEINGRTLYRIRALRDINRFIKAGDLGGFIEKEDNLSHEGNCWIADDAKVYENAQVFGNAMICESAQVYGNAKVYANAGVTSHAQVYANAKIHGDAILCSNLQIGEDTNLYRKYEALAMVWGKRN